MKFFGATEQTLLVIIQEPLPGFQNCALVVQLVRASTCYLIVIKRSWVRTPHPAVTFYSFRYILSGRSTGQPDVHGEAERWAWGKISPFPHGLGLPARGAGAPTRA